MISQSNVRFIQANSQPVGQSVSQPVGQSVSRSVLLTENYSVEIGIVLCSFPNLKTEWTLRYCGGWADVGVGAIIDCDVIRVQVVTSSFLSSRTNIPLRYCPNEVTSCCL